MNDERFESLKANATPITELLSVPMGHEQLKSSDVIWAFDTTLGTQSIVYGVESLEEVQQQGGEYLRKMRVGAVSFDTDDEWHQVCAAVLAAKGSYNADGKTIYSEDEEN